MFDTQREGLTAADPVEPVRRGLIGQQNFGNLRFHLAFQPALDIGPAARPEDGDRDSLRGDRADLPWGPGQADTGSITMHQLVPPPSCQSLIRA